MRPIYLAITIALLATSPLAAQQRQYIVPQPDELAGYLRSLVPEARRANGETVSLDLTQIPLNRIAGLLQGHVQSARATGQKMHDVDPAAFMRLGLLLGVGSTVSGPVLQGALAYVWLSQAAVLLPAGPEQQQLINARNSIEGLFPPGLKAKADSIVQQYLASQ